MNLFLCWLHSQLPSWAASSQLSEPFYLILFQWRKLLFTAWLHRSPSLHCAKSPWRKFKPLLNGWPTAKECLQHANRTSCFAVVLVVQLVSRHSCVADRLLVVVRFPAGPRARLKTVDPSIGNGLGSKKNTPVASRFAQLHCLSKA